MRKVIPIMAGMAAIAAVSGAPAAYANTTCTPGNCVNADGSTDPNATFKVVPDNVGPSYRGSISATLGNTVTTSGSFTDVFNFMLPTNGIGAGSLTTIAATFHGATDLDFVSVLINGVAATIDMTANGITEIAYGSGVMLNAGMNTITVNGFSRGNGSYGGTISFTPSVPELSTWAMLIFGFAAMGGAMRYRRKSTKVSFA